MEEFEQAESTTRSLRACSRAFFFLGIYILYGCRCGIVDPAQQLLDGTPHNFLDWEVSYDQDLDRITCTCTSTYLPPLHSSTVIRPVQGAGVSPFRYINRTAHHGIITFAPTNQPSIHPSIHPLVQTTNRRSCSSSRLRPGQG